MGEIIRVNFNTGEIIDRDKGNEENPETELCVLCGTDTGILKSSGVKSPARLGRYVEGTGQVCKNCPME